MKEPKIDEMGTHQYTRGTVGNPRKPRNTKAPKKPGYVKLVNNKYGERETITVPAIPGAEHPRVGALRARQEAFDAKANKNLTHAGVHRPGAIHSRGGRA